MFLFPTAFRSPELPGTDMSIVIFAPAAESQWTSKISYPKSPPGTYPTEVRGPGTQNQAETPQNPLKIQSLSTEMQAPAPKSNLGAAERSNHRTETRQKFMELGKFIFSRIGPERGRGFGGVDSGVFEASDARLK